MTDISQELRDDVRLLGAYLGDTIANHLGDDFVEKIDSFDISPRRGGAMTIMRGLMTSCWRNWKRIMSP